MHLTTDFMAWVSFQPGSSSALLSWWRAARALGLTFLNYCWGLLGYHAFADLHPWREVACFLGDIPYGWATETTLRLALLTLTIKRILQSLSKGNHNLLGDHVWKSPGGKKTLQEKDIVVRFTDFKARRCCEIVWSGSSITFLSSASTLTTWRE